MPEKKNPDYSATAVNLCNPPEILEKLKALRDYQKVIKENEDALSENRNFITIQQALKDVGVISGEIKALIETQGSYQDIEKGLYAVKQMRTSESYDAEKFKINYPAYVPAVIVDSVNKDALTGLLKGNLIKHDKLLEQGVIIEKHTYAYKIEV